MPTPKKRGRGPARQRGDIRAADERRTEQIVLKLSTAEYDALRTLAAEQWRTPGDTLRFLLAQATKVGPPARADE